MGKSLIDILIEKYIITNKVLGKIGEMHIENELNLVKFFGRKGKTLRNVYVPKGDDGTSEIDVVFITQKGIFVFESKNYSGWIFGNEKDRYWTASLPTGEKNSFYNPIKQNKTHLRWLAETIGDNVPLFSIIVFSEGCTLKKIIVETSNVMVIQRSYIYAAVRAIWKDEPDVLDENQIESIYKTLKAMTHIRKIDKEKHIEQIKEQLYEKKESTKAPNEKSSDQGHMLLCPSCGAEVVIRTAKTGPRAGKQFYGCSNYPSCRYIKNIE